ncbi:MAG: PEP/pyruvate-binding domain-containing protein, partial [Syntrophomonadaceae bacterium]|nr:PEP/pyruvate-binding domain-containing protein [Syntrophomonadaceae bacterium]
MVLGRDRRLLDLATRYLSLPDLLDIRARLIGSGRIGGKSAGMLLARAILRADPAADWTARLEAHDSFFVGTDVYFTHLVENDCWPLLMQQRAEGPAFSRAADLRARIHEGFLPEVAGAQFDEMLDYFGQAPIIVRSSSLLEDSFGNAFAGKYDSIFCVNQGTPQQRRQAFEDAVRQVYASSMNVDALAYRLHRGLATSDEQMALLVQRVSGSRRGRYFFPDLAGVAFSRNQYTWHPDLDPSAGMLRLVAGLGTRAVDRVEDDYPRLVPLDRPLLRPDSSPEAVRYYAQRRLDVLDLQDNAWATRPLAELAPALSTLPFWKLLAEREPAPETGDGAGPPGTRWSLTFDGLLRATGFASTMRAMLARLESAYQCPVDVEFAANFTPGGELLINLLQCRPLQTPSGRAEISPPTAAPEPGAV